MKTKSTGGKRDESLFGLLSQYKNCSSYFRVLVSEEQNSIIIQISDNPSRWLKNDSDDERFKNYKVLRRLEMGVNSASLKYLSPDHLLETAAVFFGSGSLKGAVKITNNLEVNGIIEISSSFRYLKKMLHALSKLLNITPQKKYSIIEKNLSAPQEKENDRTI